MIKFKKKDCIEHPMYGNGEIMKVNPVRDGFSILEVEFPQAGIQKQLNSQWVEKHCRHIPYRPPQKPQFRDGAYLPWEELSNQVWQVSREKDTPQSGQLREGLQYLLSAITPGVNFVQIGTCAAVVLWSEEGATPAKIEKAARKAMNGVFRVHPDFSCVETDDGGLVLLMLEDQLWQFVKPEQVQRKPDGRVSLQTLLEARMELMNACAARNMYAVAISAPAKNHTMRLQDQPFDSIRSGQKTIELRLWDEKRREISVGDQIQFTRAAGGSGSITARVVALHRFDSFAQLYAALPLERCGYTPEEVAGASYRDMERYYTAEEQRRYGVVGIELQVLSATDD